MDEALGAVDGVDDPAVVGVALGAALLLAENRVAGEEPGDALADDLLRLAVGPGDGRGVGLGLDRDLGVEVSERPPAREVGGVGGDGEQFTE